MATPAVPSQHDFSAFAAITPSDSVNETFGFRAIYVGGAGNIAVVPESGSAVTFTAVPVGTVLRVAGKRVNSTNTTASLLVGLR